MRDRRRVSIAAMLAVLLAVLGSASAVARVPGGFVGMMLGPPIYPAQGPSAGLATQLDAMVSSGVQSVRFVANWSYAQPYASWSGVPPGLAGGFSNVGGIPTRFDQIDPLVELAAQRGLTLLPVVLYAPPWAAAPHASTTYPQPSSNLPYASVLTALVQRYGPSGSFWRTHSPKVPIRMWQIWNEPNISVFWSQQPFAQSYASLLAAAHAAIKRVDPKAKVVLAGMPNFSWTALSRIYAVSGASRLFDVVAVHPYTRDPAGVITILGKIRQVMNRAGDRRKPILADEISWPSSLGHTRVTDGFDFATTRAGQARNLARLLPMLGRDRARLGLLGFDYYTWASVEQRGAEAFDFAGLFRVSLGRLIAKPAFFAFRHAALGLERCREKGRVATVCRRRG
jgi:hypothetical protein